MSNRRPPTTVSLLLAALLILPVLSFAVGAQLPDPVSNVQNAEIRRALDQNAPFGQWTENSEVSTFYMHSSQTGGVYDLDTQIGTWQQSNRAPQLVPVGPDPLGDHDGCSAPTTGQGARFYATPDVADPYGTRTRTYADTALTYLNVHVYAEAPAGANVFSVRVYDVDPTGPNGCGATRIATISLAGGGSTGGQISGLNTGARTLFTGGVDLTSIYGVDGYLMKENHRFHVEIVATGEYRMWVDGASTPSRLEVTANSARTNLWTQNHFGEVTSSFPSGKGVSTEDRRVVFHAVVANAFGLLDCPNQDNSLGKHDPNRPNNLCKADNFNENAVRFRVRDMNPDHQGPEWDAKGNAWQYNQYLPLDQGMGLKNDVGRDDRFVRCCNLDIDPIEYDPVGFLESRGVTLLRYTLVYGENFPSGRYQIEFHESDRNWKAYTTFDVGNTGYTFEFAPGEATVSQDGLIARHMVALKEPTEYIVRITNNGGATDTFGLSIPTPGKGWEAQVQPNTATIQPGNHHDFTVTVEPPTTGLAGDVKVVFVNAVSIASNEVKVLTLETTLTGERKLGIDLIDTAGGVRTRPDRTVSFPVIMRNTGTIRHDYVVTTDGVPPGWRVDTTPNFANLLAASREDLLVQVHSPVEAVPPLDPAKECGLANSEDNHPGCTWSLLLTAQSVVDNTVRDTLEIPVSVFLVDGFLATPLNRTIRMHDVAGDRTECTTFQAGCIIFAPKTTHADNTFDDAALYRIQVDNTGDRPDRIEIFASWEAPDNHPRPVVEDDPGDDFEDVDNMNCDAWDGHTNHDHNDGVPDGWRFRILDGTPGSDIAKHVDPLDRLEGLIVQHPQDPQHGAAFRWGNTNQFTDSQAFSGEFRLATLELPPHQSQDIYIEKKWMSVIAEDYQGACDNAEEDSYRGHRPSPEARLRLTFRSTNDPALRQVETLHTILTPVTDPTNAQSTAHGYPVDEKGRVPGAIHDVHLELGLMEEASKSANIYDPNDQTNFTGALYRMRATNVGNEHDNIILRVDRGQNGWSHQIIDVGVAVDRKAVPSALTTQPGGDFERGQRRCTSPQQNNLEVTCRNLGVGDVVHFTVWSLPPQDGDVGDKDRMTVTATTTGLDSRIDFNEIEQDQIFAKTLEVNTRIRGSYFFEVEDLAGERITYPGQSIAFPFTIHNLGQETDTYELSIEEAEAVWLANFGTAPRVRVPAGHSFHGFLAATVPIDWEVSDKDTRVEEHFRIKVRSTESDPGRQQTELLDFFAIVEEAPSYVVTSEALTVRSGSDQTFKVTAVQTAGGLGQMRYDIDLETVPDGYFYSCLPEEVNAIPQECKPQIPEVDVRFFDPNGNATGTFTINAPSNELGTSRVISRIRAVADGNIEDERSWHDAVTNLATRYGVSLSVVESKDVDRGDSGGFMVVRPGAKVKNTFDLEVTNTGLAPVNVQLSNEPGPEGWAIAPGAGGFLIGGMRLEPFESKTFAVSVQTPATILSGNEATILFKATVQGQRNENNEAIVSRYPMTFRVGEYKVDLQHAADTPQRAFVAPLERTIPLQFEVHNKGNVRDTVELTHQLPKAYHSRFGVEYLLGCSNPGGTVQLDGTLTCKMVLEPGEFRVVQFNVFVPNKTAARLDIPIVFTGTSLSSQLTVTDDLTFHLETIDYVEQDIDGDLIMEMAINRDRDGDNDYEEFRDQGFGIALRASPLVDFLSDEAIARMTKVDAVTGEEYLDYFVDVNGDGRTDHFLDDNKDGLPDIYWDPYHRWFHRLTVTKDVNNDGFREYFIDKDGNCQLDAYFDMVDGRVGTLLRLFVDDDDKVDYVVDRNGNNFADDADIILLGSQGAPKAGEPCNPERGFLGVAQIIQRVDMNGDGKLDTVVDTDADGNPDHFIPNGKNNPIAIVLKDVTGDQRADWTYASSGQGAPDSYYDPYNNKSGFIDTQSQFLRDLQEYWWIAVLFGFVMVLFVVLVAVTRR